MNHGITGTELNQCQPECLETVVKGEARGEGVAQRYVLATDDGLQPLSLAIEFAVRQFSVPGSEIDVVAVLCFGHFEETVVGIEIVTERAFGLCGTDAA